MSKGREDSSGSIGRCVDGGNGLGVFFFFCGVMDKQRKVGGLMGNLRGAVGQTNCAKVRFMCCKNLMQVEHINSTP